MKIQKKNIKGFKKNIKYIKKYKVKYLKIKDIKISKLILKVDKLIYLLENSEIVNALEKINNKKHFIIRNLKAGVIKGIGTGIGFSMLTALIIYILQYIIRLNIPIIGQYISDILDIVEKGK